MKSRGLQNKITVAKSVRRICPHCKGKGVTRVLSVQASAIKNLKVSGEIALEDDCPICNGEGHTISVMRVVKRG